MVEPAPELKNYATRRECDTRIATFNLESLDLPPKARVPLEVQAEMLRPALERLQADALCLQEVNGQHTGGRNIHDHAPRLHRDVRPG
jgi:hypothetical protein